jgi:hypothetical protein
MAMSKLEQMRAKLKLKEQQRKGSGGDQASFPFWNMEDGKSTTVRFLPDKNENNEWHWVERSMFKWTFVDNQNPTKQIRMTLPCREMYEGLKSCKIVNDLRPMYRGDEEDKKTAGKFWPKKSYIYHGFVRATPIVEDNPPENKDRIFVINRMLHDQIKNGFLSDDPETLFDHDPFGLTKGTNFVIKKAKDGAYSTYNSSTWSAQRYASELTDDEKANIEKFGLWDLSTRIPAKPSDEAFEVMYEMFQVAFEGGEWNPAWEKHFKPWREGGNNNQASSDDESSVRSESTAAAQPRKSVVVSKPAEEPDADQADQAPADEPKSEVAPKGTIAEKIAARTKPDDAPAAAGEKAQTVNTASVLAKLRARSQAKAQ